jgi:pimeloyl-ACP methyl ester carboxylesterase
MPESTVNGVRLYYEEHGSGDPILCIHGTSSSALVWRGAAIEALARLGRTILYDRRGCTRSERPEPYETSVAQHADDGAALLDALGAGSAVVIGRSYGGGVAVGLALRRPDLVRALVLLEAGDVTIDGEEAAWEAAMRAAVEDAAATDPAGAAKAMFDSVLGAAVWPSLPEELRGLFAMNSPAVIAEVRGARLEVDALDLARIDVPTLIVSAAASSAAFRRVSELLASGIPGARTTVVEGGHIIDPAEPSVLRFIAEVLYHPVPVP